MKDEHKFTKEEWEFIQGIMAQAYCSIGNRTCGNIAAKIQKSLKAGKEPKLTLRQTNIVAGFLFSTHKDFSWKIHYYINEIEEKENR